jgi:hypothetical protein
MRLALACLLGLAACEMSLEGGSTHAPATGIRVLEGEVTIVAPDGFCVDQKGSSQNAASPFVLMSDCNVLAGKPGFAPQSYVLSALVDATVNSGTPLVAQPEVLTAFFASDRGRMALSRAGDAATVELLETVATEAGYFLYLKDTSPPPIKGLAASYWRGLLEVKGHVVTLAVMGFDKVPLTKDQGRVLMAEMLGKVLAANAPAAVSRRETSFQSIHQMNDGL